jgi:hypothetical protein
LNVESALHPWNKSHWVVVRVLFLFIVEFDLFLFRRFSFTFMKDISVESLFLVIISYFFIWFGKRAEVASQNELESVSSVSVSFQRKEISHLISPLIFCCPWLGSYALQIV